MTERSLSLLLLFCFIIAGCFNIAGDCETMVLERVFNPTGNLQAISDVTDCGATTSPSYGVRIVESSDTTDVGSRKNTILGSRVDIKMEWKSDDTLIITGADTTSGYTIKKAYTLTKSKGQVVILYK